MPTTSEALADWREAELIWEQTRLDDPAYRGAGIAVVAAWLRFHELMGREPGSIVLVADDDQTYVAVGGAVKAILDYEPTELIGRRIEDIAAPDLAASTPTAWQRFLADGRQDGQFRLLRRDGREVSMRFQARAHHPILGFHSSRLWPDR